MAAQILIIEDNPANLELMRYLLAVFGYRVSTAACGEDGVAAARHDVPDLVLCDVQLPDFDGYEVVRRLRGDPVLTKVPIVAVTALAMAADREKALQAFDGYLAKPIDPVAFVPQVEAFLKLPPQNPPARAQIAAGAATAGAARNGRTILAVDDIETNLEFAISVLEKLGYRVLTASTHRAALELARTHLPDLVLSDVCMPVNSGFDLIKQFKDDPALRPIPFVFITSTAATESERRAGLKLGAVKYIYRPIEPQDLIREIESVLAEA